ncbi:MAG: GAF domain-containing protein [Ramlibacter sp.]
MLKSLGLRTQLALLVAAALVPVFLLVTLSALAQRDAALAQARASLLAEVRLAAARQQRLVDRTHSLLQAMTSAPAVKDAGLGLCPAFMKNMLAGYPGYVLLGLATPDGRLACKAPQDGPDVNLGGQAFLRAALAGDAFAMGDYQAAQGAQRPMLSFGAPVYQPDGTLAGVAVAALDATALVQALAPDVADGGLALLLTDRRGVLLAAQPGGGAAAPVALGREVPDVAIRQALQSRDLGQREAPDARGMDRVYAFSAVARGNDRPGPGLLVAASRPRDQILAPSWQDLMKQLAALAVAVLLGVAGAWWIGTRMILRPASNMLRVVHEVESGDLAARLDAAPASRRDELSRLGRSINRMAAAMQARQQALDRTLDEAGRNQAMLELIVNSMREGVMAVDLDGNFLVFNTAAAQFHRIHLAQGNLAALNQWHELYTPDGQTPLALPERPLTRALAGESLDDFEMLVRTEDVSDRMLSCSARPLRDAQQQTIGALLVFTDITARNAARRQRQRQEQVLELIAAGAPLAQVLEAVVGLVEVQSGAGMASVMLVQGDSLRLAAAPSLPPLLRQRLDSLPVGEQGGVCGAAAARREMVVVVDIQIDPLTAGYRELAQEHGVRACWSMPVLSGAGEALATFAVYHRDVQRPGPQALALIETAARLVRIAIERDRAAQAVQASEARFRELADTVDDVFYVRELAGDRLLYVSPAYERVWGHSVASVMEKPWSFLASVHPDDIEQVRQDIARQREGHATAAEFRITRPDGGLSWVRNDAFPVLGVGGRVERIVGTLRDVTQRKLAEQRLAWTNRSLKMLSRCNGALVRLDDEPRLLDEVCRLAVEVGGYRMAWVGYAQDGGECLIRPMAHAGHEQGYLSEISLSWRDDEPRGLGPAGRAVRTGQATVSEDITHEDSGFLWQGAALSRGFRSLICLPLCDESRSFGLLALFGADTRPVKEDEVHLLQELADNLAFGIVTIRERKRAHDEIVRLNALLEQRVRQRTGQLEAANRELEAFSSSVAHDLRAPLAAIDGFSAALERDPPPAPERAAHYLRRVRAGVRQMGDMIDALLSLAQLSRASLRWEAVDLTARARRVLEGLREHEPQRAVAVSVEDGLRVQGDPRLLDLVLENLLGNAWKFTATREQADIQVGRAATSRGDAGQAFYVRDNGVGFDMAYADKLFGAFQRLHGAGEFPGIGLGLANVRRIVARHGGQVWAESRPGEGATFYFTLGEQPPDEDR